MGMHFTVRMAVLGGSVLVLCSFGASLLFAAWARKREARLRQVGATRHTGCSSAWGSHQILGHSIVGLLVLMFYGVLLPPDLGSVDQLLATLIHAVIALCAIVCGALVECSDPGQLGRGEANTAAPVGDEDTVIPYKYCFSCKRYFTRGLRYHCRSCNKCVVGFDHHCEWLNACIGEHNYWTFFSSMALFWSLMVWQEVIGILVLLDLEPCMVDQCKPSVEHRFAIASGYFIWSELYLAFIIVHNVFTLLLLAPLSFLMLFHLRLCYKGLTTYQWLQLYGNPCQREYDSGEFAGDYLSFTEEIVRHASTSQRNSPLPMMKPPPYEAVFGGEEAALDESLNVSLRSDRSTTMTYPYQAALDVVGVEPPGDSELDAPPQVLHHRSNSSVRSGSPPASPLHRGEGSHPESPAHAGDLPAMPVMSPVGFSGETSILGVPLLLEEVA